MAAAYVAPSRREQLQALLMAALCSLLFLGPGLLPGRAMVPYPPELLQPMRAEAMQSGAFDPEAIRGNPGMGDKYQLSLAWDRILQDRLREGGIPRWTRDIGGGTSFIPQIPQVYQPWNLLLLVWPSTQIYGIWFLLHQLALGWFAYLFFRQIGTGHQGALLGMVALVIGMFTQSRVHQQVILSAALPLFPMLYCVHGICRGGGGARHAAGLALAAGISWLAAFPIVSLLGTYLAGAYCLVLILGNDPGSRLRPLGWGGAGFLLGGALSLAQMIPVLGAMTESARLPVPPDALHRLVLEWDYLATLVWPDLLHWPGEHFYIDGDRIGPRAPWTDLLLVSRMNESGFNYPETSFAIGIPALLAALLAFGNRPLSGQAGFFAAAAAISFLAASVPAAASLVPGLGASDPKRMVFLVAFCLPVLAAIGGDRLSRAPPPRWWLITACSVCGVSGVLAGTLVLSSPDGFLSLYSQLLAWGPLDEATRSLLASGAHPDAASAIRAQIEAVAHPDEAAVNRAHLLATFLRAFLVSGACLGALRLPRAGIGWVFIALAAVELLHAGHGAVVSVPAERVERIPAVLAPIAGLEEGAPGLRPRLQRLAAEDDDEALSLYPPNLGAYHGFEDLAAFLSLPPVRMEELFLAVEPADPGRRNSVALGGAGVNTFRRAESLTHPLLDLLGVRYILSARTVEAPGIVDRTEDGAAAPYRLYERTTCLPRATFVSRAVVVEDRQQRLRLLADPDRDVAGEMILEDPDAPMPESSSGDATVQILEHRDERVSIAVRNDVPGYLRLADPYDSGWTATVNGEPREIHVADHYLRAVYLEPGEHEIVFRFDGTWVVWPERLSLLALAVIAALGFWPQRQGDG